MSFNTRINQPSVSGCLEESTASSLPDITNNKDGLVNVPLDTKLVHHDQPPEIAPALYSHSSLTPYLPTGGLGGKVVLGRHWARGRRGDSGHLSDECNECQQPSLDFRSFLSLYSLHNYHQDGAGSQEANLEGHAS